MADHCPNPPAWSLARGSVKPAMAAFLPAALAGGYRPSAVRRISVALYKALGGTGVDTDGRGYNGPMPPVRRKPESLRHLCQMTKFSKKELQLLYRGFKEGCPSGVVTLERFKEIYAQFFPHGSKNARYALYVFNTFDQDKRGDISFDEFVMGLSILCRGTVEQKLRWLFELYDVDQDGELTRADLENVVGSIYEMMGTHSETETIKARVEFLLNKLDEDGDGVITLQEFLKSSMHDSTLRQSLGLFDTIISSTAI